MPSSSDRDQLSEIIRSLSTENDAPLFNPHCTIFSHAQDLDSAKSIIDQLNFKPFEAKVNGLQHSDYIWKTIFFELESNPHLLLLNYVFDQAMVADYQFEPHVSLIYKEMSDLNREKIISKISTMPIIHFDRIAVVNTSGPVSEWESVYEKAF